MRESTRPRADDERPFHRPVRAWPLMVEPASIVLPPVPAGAAGPRRRWAQLLPMVGSLAMVGFALIVHSLLYFVVIVVMVVGMVGATLATQVVTARDERRGRTRARTRFREAVDAARDEARAAAGVQRAALVGLHPDPAGLLDLVRARDGIWERRPTDPDFATVRLGLGLVAAARPVVPVPDAQATSEPDPELAELAEVAASESRILPAAPVTVPLRELGVVAVVGPAERARALAGAWMASLAALHAPGELRFVGLVPEDAIEAWNWLKWLPHCRDPEGGEGFGRARRAVGTDVAAFSARVAGLVRARLERPPAAAPSLAAGDPLPGWDHVVVLVDGWSPARTFPALETLMAAAGLAGVSVVALVEDASGVPAECGAIVTAGSDGTVRLVESGPGGRVETDVVADALDAETAERLARELAPLRLDATSAGASLGDSVRLAELLGADDPAAAARAAPCLGRPGGPSPLSSSLLRAPIGRDDGGQPVELDLKEAALGGMGPHGLLVGATGSGKSELLRSLAAALATEHRPSLLNLLLVDYKGGAAFAGLERLPHVAGLVTNLADEPDLIARVQAALAGELERRQRLLRDAGGLDSIRDYHATGAADAGDMPYLVVIVDEFGELLAAEPAFLEIFEGIGRLGRSLGMHLLLSTQRLDEGRVTSLEPHLRYRIALRTNTAAESRSVLGSALAHELPPVPGLGYLQVDGTLTRLKAAITTLPHRRAVGTGELRTQWTRALTLVSSGTGEAGAPDAGAGREGRGGRSTSELDVLVDAICGREDVPARRVWLPPLPERVTLAALARRFGGAGRVPAIGLVDHPRSQRQLPLVWDPWATGGNVGVAGGPRSGKSTFLVALVLALTAEASPDDVQFYGIDLGGGTLLALRDLPHVGALVGPGEPDGAIRLVEEVLALVNERAMASPAAGGSLAGPHVFVLVDNVAMVRHHCPDLEAPLFALATTGRSYGVHLVLSANRWFDVRPQLLDALGTKLELRLGDPAETLAPREAARRLPADRPGRGVTSAGDAFQLALPSWSEEPGALPATDGVAEAVRRAAARAEGRRAPRIAALPERVTEEDAVRLARLATAAEAPRSGGEGFLLGLGEFRSRPVEIDLLDDGAHLAVYGDGGSGRSTVLARALRHLFDRRPADELAVHLVDPTRRLIALADDPHVRTYATSPAAAEKLALELARQLAARQPPEDATIEQLRSGRLWAGPLHVVAVDDYDLLLGTMGSPLDPLAEAAGQARDVGLHLLVTRRVAGFQRSAFDPFTQRLRELRPTSLVLAGPPDEGPIVAGVSARPMPPGRAQLVDPTGRRLLVQCCLEEAA